MVVVIHAVIIFLERIVLQKVTTAVAYEGHRIKESGLGV